MLHFNFKNASTSIKNGCGQGPGRICEKIRFDKHANWTKFARFLDQELFIPIEGVDRFGSMEFRFSVSISDVLQCSLVPHFCSATFHFTAQLLEWWKWKNLCYFELFCIVFKVNPAQKQRCRMVVLVPGGVSGIVIVVWKQRDNRLKVFMHAGRRWGLLLVHGRSL